MVPLIWGNPIQIHTYIYIYIYIYGAWDDHTGFHGLGMGDWVKSLGRSGWVGELRV